MEASGTGAFLEEPRRVEVWPWKWNEKDGGVSTTSDVVDETATFKLLKTYRVLQHW